MTYEAGSYWESLLSKRYDLRGVSYPDMPSEYAEALYRQMDRAVEASITGPHGRIVDIGSGTGHWLRFWKRHGATDLTSVELTEHASEQLRRSFPDVTVLHADVADTPLTGEFDAVSATSVLLHIIDDDRVESAIASLADCLCDGGTMYLMDPIRHNDWYGPVQDGSWNSTARSAVWWTSCLDRHDLEVQEIRPVTALLANAIDVRGRWQYAVGDYWWRMFRRLVRLDGVRRPLLHSVELVDRRLVKAGFGPATKLLVARRRTQ